MNRREFLRAAPVVASMGAASAASGSRPSGLHLSCIQDSPFYAGHLLRSVKRVLLNGEHVAKCVEASEPDGFVIQNLDYRDGSMHLLREPRAVFVPATVPGGRARVKRFGVVRIEFKEPKS